ncbi:Cytochrome c-type biogenesis protein CcmG/DsbE, thiol:disulfide oxidoreductase [hydrothermal vent metagenome]|uniref:Cytochrome c-type biogenesis protein CcmG/DsbE, thiol:disulfide oxidoreductase n=1 Tax=hydrothermal vent metagenome TaxID=652676 RepID=A0A3B0XQ45_9ZZZZ
MSRFIVPAVFFIMIGAFALVLDRMGKGEYNPRDIPTEFIGRAAPSINVPDLYTPTDIVRVGDMKGKVWLFNVWGTWCPECWREHRYLMELKRKGIPIVGLNWRDEAAEAKGMLSKMGNPFIKIGFDPQSVVAIEWGVYGAPETFLVNAEGIVVAKHAGGVTPSVWKEKFKKHFETPAAAAIN